jgi:HEAT repeat protein
MPSDPQNSRAQRPKGPVRDGQDTPTAGSISSLFREAASTVIPFVGALCAVDWIFSELGIVWRIPHSIFLAAFAISILILGYFLHFAQQRMIDFLGASTRKRREPQSRGAKALRFTIVMIVIPILVSFASAKLYFPITRFFDGLFGGDEETTALAAIANSVLSSTELKTKEAGIEALGTIDTRESANELRRVLENEKQCFSDSECYNTARNALVGAHEKSIPEILLAVLELHLDDAKFRDTAKTDVNQRYFQPDLMVLRRNLQSAGTDTKSQEQISRKLDSLEAQLTASLGDIEKDLPAAPDHSALTELILQSYAERARGRTEAHEDQENPKANTEMINLARQIADNASYSSAVRTKAVALVGAIGQESDKEWLLKWVSGQDEGLRLSAMRAFAALDFRIHHRSN